MNQTKTNLVAIYDVREAVYKYVDWAVTRAMGMAVRSAVYRSVDPDGVYSSVSMAVRAAAYETVDNQR